MTDSEIALRYLEKQFVGVVFLILFCLIVSSKTKLVLGLLETRWKHQMSLNPGCSSRRVILNKTTPSRQRIFFWPDRLEQSAQNGKCSKFKRRVIIKTKTVKNEGCLKWYCKHCGSILDEE